MEIHHAVDLRDLRRILRTTSFKKLRHPRQPTGNVLRLGDLTRRLGHPLPRLDFLAVLHLNVGPRRNTVSRDDCTGLIDNRDLWVQILFVLNDNRADRLSSLVDLFLHRHPFEDVFKFNSTGFFRQNGNIVRIPLNEALTLLYLAALWDGDHRANHHRIPL